MATRDELVGVLRERYGSADRAPRAVASSINSLLWQAFIESTRCGCCGQERCDHHQALGRNDGSTTMPSGRLW